MKNSEIHSWPDLSQDFFSLSNSLWALVPLEAWRRGLTVTLAPDARYTISDGRTELTFWQTRLTGSEHDRFARISDDKHATREMLLQAGLPAPQGRGFQGAVDVGEVQDYAKSLGFPVCLKPNSWAKGRGVYPRLEDSGALAEALDTLVGELGCDDLVVEQHIQGDALRLFVAGDQVIAATLAEPANVVGDGVSSIAQLIEAKGRARRANPHLRNHSLAVNADTERVLATAGLTTASVPPAGAVVQLREAANLAQGGDSWDVTDALPQTIRDLAVDAVKATPGLTHAGVDLLVEDHTRPDAPVFVNELNPSAGLGGHVYPGNGISRDVPAAIIDHHFPGTERLQGATSWYFPLNQVNRLLVSRVAASVELPPMPAPVAPTWLVLRVQVPATSRVRLRSSLLGKLNRSQAHGQIGLIEGEHFDVAMAGDEPAVHAASRIVRREAQALKGTAKVASRARFPAAVGIRMA